MYLLSNGPAAATSTKTLKYDIDHRTNGAHFPQCPAGLLPCCFRFKIQCFSDTTDAGNGGAIYYRRHFSHVHVQYSRNFCAFRAESPATKLSWLCMGGSSPSAPPDCLLFCCGRWRCGLFKMKLLNLEIECQGNIDLMFNAFG